MALAELIPNPPPAALALDTSSSPVPDGQPAPEVPLPPAASPPGVPDATSRTHVASAGAGTVLGLVPPKGSTPKTRPFLHRQFCRRIPAAVSWRICFALLCSLLGTGVTYSRRKRPRQGRTWHGPVSCRCISALLLSAMRKLLLPETVGIVQQTVPSDLPEQLAVTLPSSAQAVEQDLSSGGER